MDIQANYHSNTENNWNSLGEVTSALSVNLVAYTNAH
jgi:hypothetical protein